MILKSRERKNMPFIFMFIALASAAFLGMIVGCGESQKPYSLPQENFEPLINQGSKVILSSDQAKVIEELGYPDHFFISIDPKTADRVETWTYFTQRAEYTFRNGRKLRKQDAEDQSREYPRTSLKPEDFGPALTLTEANNLLGRLVNSKSFQAAPGEDTILLIYEKGIVTFTNGKFAGVDTMVHPYGEVKP